ncbi:ribonuclease P protein component [Flagellimonas meishanensis]|uniref:ribonuclease P protein component n=1 Tax=Flagellimonas meishanensis TaxID=2873264 RepID=UPI001CA787CB|nr:ribonuclease P protein component [[Muricauda] meishanensis]
MEKTVRFTFPKKERLKSKKLFKALFTEGSGIREHALKLLYIKTAFDDDVQFKVAFVAPKKKFNSAVKRNRIKRLMLEAYRMNKPLVFNNMEGNFAFLFLYLGDDMPNLEAMDKGMKKLLTAFLKKERNEKNV